MLVESDAGLVLIDTGLGLRDVAAPSSRLSRVFRTLMSPTLSEELTAARQIERMGFHPVQVRHIVLSHLDFDHAGGLDDFPNATVHLLRRERDGAFRRRTPLARMRYRPQQWSTASRWRTYDPDEGERWFGFDCVRELEGLPPEILMIPLYGHTCGHAGVAVQRDDGGWLLHAADAYFCHREMDPVHPHCTKGLRFYQWMMEMDREDRLANQARLRELIQDHGDHVEVICSHDVLEFERASGRRPRQLPDPLVSGGGLFTPWREA